MLYKFFTPTCAPCKAMDAYLESKHPELELVRVDLTDPDNKYLSELYSVYSVPTLIDTYTGKTLVGFQPQRLEEYIRSIKNSA